MRALFMFLLDHTHNTKPVDIVYIAVYTIYQEMIAVMKAKLFENGRSQAVRLPKECRFDGEEVIVNKIGDIVLLIPQDNKWAGFLSSLDMFSEDFMADGRADSPVQEREEL